MTKHEQFDGLIAGLKGLMGCDFELDAEGLWAVPLASGLTMHVGYREDLDQVIAFARLGELEAGEGFETVAACLLSANAYWRDTRGFTISLDPDTGALMLHDRRSAEYFAAPEELRAYADRLETVARELNEQMMQLLEELDLATAAHSEPQNDGSKE